MLLEKLNLLNQTPWGYGLKSLIGGVKNIHPYYVEELYNNSLSSRDIWNSVDIIKQKAPLSFDRECLNKISVNNLNK